MHVVLVGDYPQEPKCVGGGVEAVVLYLAQALQRDPELKLDVVTLEKQQRGEHTEQHGNVTVHYVPVSTRPSRLSTLANIRSLQKKIVALRPDLVHAHIASEYALAAAQTGLPWVLTLHGIRHLEASLRPGLINRYRRWFTQKDEFGVIRQAKHLISISPFIESVFAPWIVGTVYTIENPIAEVFFDLPQQQERGRLLYAGRLIPRKDLLTLLQAFAQVHEQMPEATLRLAGGSVFRSEPGAYHLELKRFVVEAGLEGAVSFLGQLDEPALLAEYAACSALVLSSKLETAPMVIMQAMAAGKPVVSTDAGGARYLVEDGKTGYVAPIADVHSLADALLRTLQDEAHAAAMGRQAKALAEQRFRATAVAEQTRAVYDKVLGEG